MSLSINARLQRGYQLSRRLRRFARQERDLRSRWGPHPRLGMDLLADGFHRDKLGLYPGIEDPAIRAAYVNDITALRVRMFNGKSGDLLTQKDVLLRVLAHHLPWGLTHHHVTIDPADDDPVTSLHRQLTAARAPVFALLPSLDLTSPRLIDLGHLADPNQVPRGRPLLLELGSSSTSGSKLRPEALQQAAADPIVLQIAIYWDRTRPFVGHAVALRGGDGVRPGWPEVGPGLHIDRLDPVDGSPVDGVRIDRAAGGRLLRHQQPPSLPVPGDAVHATMAQLLALARRFPNLHAVGFSLLVVDGELIFIDAENRLDIVHPQLFGPLLADPRLRTAYLDAGMRGRDRQTRPLVGIDHAAPTAADPDTPPVTPDPAL